MPTQTLTRIGPGIHAYFDIIPESPDGEMVTWFQFDGKPLNHGRVMIARRDGSDARPVCSCAGIPHCGAFQGWLDNDHIYFSSGGRVSVTDRNGRVVRQFDGAVDTIHQGTRQGLMHSHGMRETGDDRAQEEACWRMDLDTGKITQLLNRDTALPVLAKHQDLSGVDIQTLKFKHTKWAPNGKEWFVVFNNEKYRKDHPDVPRVKVLLAADADGNSLRYIGPFGHHPNWLPDGSGIYAFAGDPKQTVLRWDRNGGEPTVFTTLPCEGHPCVSPDGTKISTDGHGGFPEPGKLAVLVKDLSGGEVDILAVMDDPVVDWQTLHPKRKICHPHPVWSGDGKRLYFNIIEDEMPVLVSAEMS